MADFFASTLAPRRGGAAASTDNALSWSSLLAPEAPRTPQGWTIPEAFIAILFAAVTCDGEIASVEHEELLALVHRSRALKTLTTEQLAGINTRILTRLREEETALSDACAALPEEMRLSVFAHALDLILADGELTIDEADFLNALILDLKIDHDGVSKIAEVIALKNRF